MEDTQDNIARIDATLTVLPEQALLNSLHREWVANERELMWHNGVPTPKFNCDHNIQDDPLLKEAIKQIRDQFFIFFNRQFYLDKLISNIPPGNAMRAHAQSLSQSLNQSLREHCLESYRRLRHLNYGFSDVAAADILRGTSHYGKQVDYAPLSEENAYEIFRKIVGRSIRAFKDATGYQPSADFK